MTNSRMTNGEILPKYSLYKEPLHMSYYLMRHMTTFNAK